MVSIPDKVSIRQLISRPIKEFSMSIGTVLTRFDENYSSFYRISLNTLTLLLSCIYGFINLAFEEAFKKFKMERDNEYFSLSSSSCSTTRIKFLFRMFKASSTVLWPNFC